MPHQFWRHTCGATQVLTGTPVCRTCGIKGEFHGWRLGMHESMARYQYVYGLKPIGPHRQLADDLLGDLRVPCPRCHWDGIITVEEGTAWRICPECEGTGGFWNRPSDEVDAVRRQILREFPDAAARPLPGFITVGVVLDLSTNEMLAAPVEGRAGRGVDPEKRTS